jgi:hypothetical protein
LPLRKTEAMAESIIAKFGRFSRGSRFGPCSGQATPAKRDTPLAIAMPPDALHPNVFEVLPVVYDGLAAIDEWTDRSTLGATPEADRLIGDLAAHGLIEVRG